MHTAVRRTPLALLALLCLSLLFVSAALAGTPSTVTVRVVGLTGTTLLPQTTVTTTTTPVDPNGEPGDLCSGTSAGGALYDAVQGNWVVKYDGAELGYEIDGIQGLNFPPFSETPDAYWSFWLNDAPDEEFGACGQELSSGDEIVFFAQCEALGTDCPTSATEPEHFLTETEPVSSSVEVDAPVSVTVGSLNTGTGKAEPSLPGGVTVGAGAVSATPNAQGVATLSFPSVGTYTIQATAPDAVPSSPRTVCVHDGDDGACGTTLACPTASSCGPPVVCAAASSCGPPVVCPEGASCPAQHPSPEVAHAAGVIAGHAYPRHRAPRILAGSVEVPAGNTLHEVRIALSRRAHGRCYAFSGPRAAFVRASCRAVPRFFAVASTSSFTYLLPARLRAGRYVYDVEAVNDAGQVTPLTNGVSHVAFSVR
jgi:hypothetical protein